MRYGSCGIGKIILGLGALIGVSLAGPNALSMEPVVYSVYQAVPLGMDGETSRKDFYLNIGTTQGVRVGSEVEVIRKVASYDLLGKKLYKEITFPIGILRVIHVEAQVSIARLDKMNPVEATPIQSPHAVMVGDYVRLK